MKNSAPVNESNQSRCIEKAKQAFPSRLKAVMAAVLLATSAVPAYAVLERVGPTSNAPSIGGYPVWYQDTTGLTLEFCDPKNQLEVDGGWCLLLPTDVTAVPETFPTNFFDEHFYFAGTALMDAANGGKATLVLAVEGAFATGPAIPGDQITFARIRTKLTNLPASGTYRVIHPYGEELIDGVAGGRLFVTQDVGIGAPGDFSAALTSRLGPFLLPADVPGGAELAPVAGPAGLYIADAARIGPVTGSTLPDFIDSTGALRNHNIFRIEGPVGSGLGGPGIDFIETAGFSLMGRVFTGTVPGRIDVNRASYTRDATGQKVDVYAKAFSTVQARVPPAPPSAPVLPQLSFFDAPCTGTVDPVTGAILPPYGAPTAAVETLMSADGSHFWGQAQPVALPAEVCVLDNSATDALGNPAPVYVLKPVTDEVTITQAYYDPVAQALSVAAASSDTLTPPTLTLAFGTHLVDLVAGQASVTPLAAPPSKISVRSSALGSSDYLVTTTPPPAPPGTAPVIATTPVLTATDGVAFSYSIAATDVEGGPLAFSLDLAPAGMTISAAGALGATIAWTPTAADVGTQTVTVRATDPTGLSTTQSYSIVVAAAAPGTAPVIGSTPVLAATDGVPYAYGVTGSDVEGGPLTFSLDLAPAGMTISAVDGFSAAIAWTPTTADVGPQTVTVRATDPTGLFTTQTYSIAVAAAGTAPVIGSAPVLSATDGAPYAYGVTATDAEGGPLTFTLDLAPAGMTISAAGPLGATIAWTPTTAQVGPQAVTVRATDPTGLFTTQTYSIAVAAAGTAPVISSTPVLSATDGQPYSYGVTGTDADGGPLAFTLDQAPAGMTISAVDGFSATIAWVPTSAQVGPQTVTVRATDPTGLFATQSWSITVASATVVNNPPVVANDTFTMIRGTTMNFAAPGVLANDSDPDAGDTLTATNWNQPGAGGTLVGNPDGSFSYTPPPAFRGLTSFSYLARDNHGMPSTTAGFASIAVRDNRAPTTVQDTATTAAGTPLVIDVLGNDSDLDTVIDPSNHIDPSTVFIPVGKGPDKGGSVVVNADGTITYTPAPGFTGIERIQYAVRDTYITPAISKAAVVEVTVQ